MDELTRQAHDGEGFLRPPRAPRTLCWWIRMMQGQPPGRYCTVGVDFGPWKSVRLYVEARAKKSVKKRETVIVIDEKKSFILFVIKRRFSGH